MVEEFSFLVFIFSRYVRSFIVNSRFILIYSEKVDGVIVFDASPL